MFHTVIKGDHIFAFCSGTSVTKVDISLGVGGSITTRVSGLLHLIEHKVHATATIEAVVI